jgi:hypothetical protein
MTLIEHVQSIYHRVVLWWRPPPPPFIERLPQPIERSPFPLAPIAPAAGQYDVDSGEFYFREAILDQLDYYFTCIKRMRRSDPDAFGLYSRVGALLMPRGLLDDSDYPLIGLGVSSWFRTVLPDFGAVFYGDKARRSEAEVSSKKHSLWPRFFYFRKYKHGRGPVAIEPVTDGAVYVLTAYWDRPEEKGFKAAPSELAVAVERDGSVRLLRTLTSETVTIRHKRGIDRGRRTTFERPVWAKGGAFLRGWAGEHRIEAEEMAQRLFAQATVLVELAQNSMVRVSVNRADLTAAFTVNIKRTPYFFKDRELVVNENGRRKRIFHIVRPHVRADGRAVKMHFRGMRDFAWNGYRIVVTVPGLHHAELSELNRGMIDGQVHEGYTMPQSGELLRERIQRRVA